MSSLDALREAVRLSPENVPLLSLYAHACVEQVLPDEARDAFERILALEPGHVDARIGMARVLYQVGRHSEAVVRLEALLQDRPDEVAALRLLTRVLLAEGNRDAAREAYRRSLAAPGATPDAELEAEFGPVPPAARPGSERRVPLGSSGDALDDDEDDDEDDSPFEFASGAESLTFEDVGGMDPVKEEVRLKILYPMQNPELYRAYGKSAGGGVLLFGPPGCGKTMLARAIAGETKSRFLSVGLHDVLDMYLGNSEKALHHLFEMARRERPCALFFDEVDALAASRTDLRRSAGRTLVNQFLSELDGAGDRNEGVMVLAATNAPWHMDAAFLRPGRFDRVLFVPPPDEAARVTIVQLLARGRPVSELDAVAIARKTSDFSGADLRQVFELATERCLSEAMRKGKVVPLTTRSLTDAAKNVKPSTRTWFENARNYALYSNADGLYDGVLAYLGLRK